MRFSVLLLTWNRLSLVSQCLESLMDTLHRPDVEVLIWDNASNDGTREYISRFSGLPNVFVHFHPKNIGVAPARAQLWPLARGEIVISIDSDVIATDNLWLEKIEKMLSDSSIGLCGIDGCDIDLSFENYWILVSEGQCDVVSGWFQAVHRRAINLGVRFDANYGRYFFEDYDLCMQVHSVGLSVICSPNIGLKHCQELSDEHPSHQWNLARSLFDQKWKGLGLTRAEKAKKK